MKRPKPSPYNSNRSPSPSEEAALKRLAELEIRFTFQEDQVESLHKVAYEQGLLIDKLQQRIDQLATTQRLAGGGNSEGEEAPPPHY